MLVELNPGLVCKACKNRMKIAHDIHGNFNLVLKEDKPLPEYLDFEVSISCMNCATNHIGRAFIRESEFKGVYKYDAAEGEITA